jgi:oligoendopeptidase F
LTAQRRLADRDKLEALFDGLRDVRRRIARNADLPDFRAYAFRGYQRFDYTPEDCLRFHEAIERTAVPARSRAQRPPPIGPCGRVSAALGFERG